MAELLNINVLDFNRCILCDSHEMKETAKLQCPAQNSKRNDKKAGYRSLIKQLRELSEHGKEVAFDLLPDSTDDEMAEILFANSAAWHKTCRLKYSNKEVKRTIETRTACGKEDKSTKYTRSHSKSDVHDTDSDECMFCGKGWNAGTLHETSTYGIDSNIRKCVLQLQDEKMLAKLSVGGDVMAHDLQYHLLCLQAYYRKAESVKKAGRQQSESNIDVLKGLAFAEVISYIEECRESNTKAIPLSDICDLYKSLLEKLGVHEESRVHSTRLKEKVLTHVPGLRAINAGAGKEVLLAFDNAIGDVLKEALKKNRDEEGIELAAAAKIICRDILEMEVPEFSGSFKMDDHDKSCPASLLVLLHLILHGPSSKAKPTSSMARTRAVINISELITFNTMSSRSGTGQTSYHSRRREPPLPLYLGLVIHAKTRSSDLVNTLHDEGLSVSYDRVLNTSTVVANRAISQFESEGVICPRKLRFGILTVGLVDNVDHNPSSTTAQSSFHGTSISLIQHPTPDKLGVERKPLTLEPSKKDTWMVAGPEVA